MSIESRAPPYAAAVDRYFEAWNSQDRAKRLAAVRGAFADGARYADPMGAATGHETILDIMGAAHARIRENFPSFTFARKSQVNHHHDRVRFVWTVSGPDGTAALTGLCVALLDESGRFGLATGFFGEIPPAP